MVDAEEEEEKRPLMMVGIESIERVPSDVWSEVSISVGQSVDPSLRQTTCLTTGYAASIVGNNEVRSLGLRPNEDKSVLQPDATLLIMASMVELLHTG
jgi:hypothetical protein